MHANEKLINDFYGAFQKGDGDAMAACYHDDATFRDPVFPKLSSAEVKAMWRMFCSGEVEVKVEYSDVSCTESDGRGHWEAHYPFRTTGRPVHNCIDAAFTFKDGKILTHVDTFPFWKWTRMALGAPGLLLGWTPLVRKKVQGLAKKSLDEFIAKQDA
jgi:ketosteroid isomerase-like protein